MHAIHHANESYDACNDDIILIINAMTHDFNQ